MAQLKELLVVIALGFTVVSWAATMSGCEARRMASAADVERLGTKHYPGRKPNDVRRAVVTALKLQGYTIVTESPRVRTAPKPIAVHAVGGGGRAVGFDETMAWDVDVGASSGGATARLHMRGQIRGQPMSGLFYDYVEQNCNAIFADVDASLAAR